MTRSSSNSSCMKHTMPNMQDTKASILPWRFWPAICGGHSSLLTSLPTSKHVTAAKSTNHPLSHWLDSSSPYHFPHPVGGSISVDFMTGLPKTAKGHDAICVFVDRLSKYVHIIPTKLSQTAIQFATVFRDNNFRPHGMPKSLVSDRDPKFTSDFRRELFAQLDTHLNLSTAYHPQTDGQTKNANRHIGAYLRHYIAPYQRDWDKHLTCAEFALNSHRSSTTGFTPFDMVYGRHPITPLTLANEIVTVNSDKTPLSVEDFIRNWHMDLQTAKAGMETAQQRQQRYANRHRRDLQFEPGDLVMITTSDIKIRTLAAKFKQRWIGPHPITHRTGAVTYRIKLSPGLKRLHPIFHASKLKALETSDPNPSVIAPTWILTPRTMWNTRYLRSLSHEYSGPPSSHNTGLSGLHGIRLNIRVGSQLRN
jgi:hypothetical protein